MDDGFLWEPSTKKETAYYDKLFGVVDRDKTGTLDGKETVQFLSLSGLSKAQLKDVWSVANSPGQAALQRKKFYVAMRAVALAQSGEGAITRERVRETATDSIVMSTFKGMPAPPITRSKGKKPQMAKRSSTKEEPTRASRGKTGIRKAAAVTPPGTSTKRTPKNKARQGHTENSEKQTTDLDASEIKKDGRAPKGSGKGRNNGVVEKTSKETTTAKNEAGGSCNSSSSSSSSGVASDSDDNGEGTSCSGGKTDDDDDLNDGSRACRDRSGNPVGNNGDGSVSESSDGDSRDAHIVERQGHDGDGNTGGSKANGWSRSSSSSSSLNDDSSRSSEGDVNEPASVAGSESMTDAVGENKRVRSERPRSSSASASSSSSSSSSSLEAEVEGLDPYSMSVKARARYQAIFNKVDATGTGSLGGKQVIGLFAKSGLDKAVLATIWRLSDLDEDGSLSMREFETAFHLIFCATQRGLDVPAELPQILWPTGYVPPSIIARRKTEGERKREEEEKKRRRRDGSEARQGDTAGKASSDAAAAIDDAKRKKKKKRAKEIGAGKRAGNRATSTVTSSTMTGVEGEEEQRKETSAREAASQQKKEELAKKRAEKAAKTKNTKRRARKSPLEAAAAAAIGTSAAPAGDASSAAAAPTRSTTVDETAKPRKIEGAMEVNSAAATASSRLDARDTPSPVGGVETDKNEVSKRQKKKREELPLAPAPARPSNVTETPDTDGDDHGREPRVAGEPAPTVPPLTMAERRARKAEARAARIEAALLKKEAAARDARSKELDLQDDSKKFTVKTLDPMKTSEDGSALHMLLDLDEDGGKAHGSGALSFARLSAPLPHLTPCPGRLPCLRLQEFSVSFPSGVRPASSLTSSLELRLGPPKVPLQSTASDGGSKDCDEGTNGQDLLRCPECAAFLTSAQISQHIRSTCRLLPCALCSCLLLPADRERHLEDTCPNRRRGCARCGEDVILSEFARHEMEGGCVRRTVPCDACGEYCCADDLREHEGKACPERDVHCPSCGDVLPARCMAKHASTLCRSIRWTCACGEGPFPLSSRPSHLKSCDAFIDAWEASIEKVIASMPKIEVVRNIGKVMISTRVEDPGITLLALAESGGSASLAARKVNEDKAYVNELCLAAEIVNVGLFLQVLKRPGKRGSGALWRAGL